MKKQITNKKMSRREAMGAISAVSLVLPATFWGCGDIAEEELDGVANDPYILGRVKYMEETSREQFYSATNEGTWEGKAGAHVPIVTFVGDGEIEVFTNHEMTFAHHITAQYVKDSETGQILGFQDYSGMDSAARTTFKIPKGIRRITVHSHCNQHENWVADDRDVEA